MYGSVCVFFNTTTHLKNEKVFRESQGGHLNKGRIVSRTGRGPELYYKKIIMGVLEISSRVSQYTETIYKKECKEIIVNISNIFT